MCQLLLGPLLPGRKQERTGGGASTELLVYPGQIIKAPEKWIPLSMTQALPWQEPLNVPQGTHCFSLLKLPLNLLALEFLGRTLKKSQGSFKVSCSRH